MKTLVAALLIFWPLVACDSRVAPAAAKSIVVDLPKTAEPFDVVIQKEVARAKAAGLRPYIEFTAEWCSPCVAFKKHLHDPLMADALEGTYLIMVDFDDFSEAAKQMSVHGIPTWIELDEFGKPTKKRITSSVWGDDIPSNMAPPLKAFFAKS